MALPAAVRVAVWLAVAAACARAVSPQVESRNGNLYLTVDTDKKIMYRIGDDAARSFQDDIDAVDAKVTSLGQTVTGQIATVQQDVNQAREQTATLASKVTGVEDAAANNLKQVNQSLLAAVSDEQSRARRAETCASTDRDAIYDKILSAFTQIADSAAAKAAECQNELNTCQAQLAARAECPKVTASSSGGSPLRVVAVSTHNCVLAQATANANDCPVSSQNEVSVLVQGPMLPSATGIYKCQFSDATETIMTSAVAEALTSGADNYAVKCNTPSFASSRFSTARFSMNVTLLGNNFPIPPYVDGFQPTVTFATEGPVIAFDGDETPFVILKNIATADRSVTFAATVTDADSTDKATLVSVKSKAPTFVADNQIALTGAFPSPTLKVIFPATMPTSSPDGFQLDIAVTLKDSHNNNRETILSIEVLPSGYALALNLNTNDGNTRGYQDPFWTQKDLLVNEQVTTHLGQKDVRTRAYEKFWVGPRIKLVAHRNGQDIAVATYAVSGAYQRRTLMELLTGAAGDNLNFASKDTASSTPGQPMLNTLGFNGNQGGGRPVVGDLFFDYGSPLRASITSMWSSEMNRMRLATDMGVSTNGHTYGGLGGQHKHGGWCNYYEWAPMIGYCDTWNTYGAPQLDGQRFKNFPPGFETQCSAHPNLDCNGEKRRFDVSLAIYVDVP